VPLLLLPLLILLALAALVALIPLALVQRYRIGTSRQRARGWLATLNLAGLALSAIVLVSSAAVTTIWVPWTLTYAAIGLGTGAALGIVGLWLTRWEPPSDALYYTPNRLLVLAVMLVVAGRLTYGVWLGWQRWRAGMEGESWFVAAGVAGSMAAGAVVIGYYLIFWIGVRRKSGRHSGHRSQTR
jgi:hypothetical protein